MAAEEDKKFDAVLGGFLVNGLRARAADLHCPESDTLAAYHERSLLPEEMNSWKEHIVGCARCQAILAELEATDSVPLLASEKEEVLQAAAARGADKSIAPRKEVTATLPEKSRVTSISRRARWQWLAPAGAIAAALLVWVAWHENRGPQRAVTGEVKTAKLEPPAAPPQSVARDDRQAASPDEAARNSKDQSAVAEGLPSKPAAEPKSLKQFEKSDSRGRVTRSEAQADKEAKARAATGLDSMAAANRPQNQPAHDAKAGVAGAASETVEVQTSAANVPVQNEETQQNSQVQQNQLSGQKVSGPNPSRQVEKAKKSKSESPALTYRAAAAPAPKPAPSAPAPATAFNDVVSLQVAAAINPSVIATPGGKSFWRVGHAGMIEFSNDGGASWLRQASNVFADLTAGSAPSDKVCWIVGRAGTILLTTDAGSHWAILHSPLAEDLGGVRATDALHATIWNLGNTKSLETSDGGLTWKPLQTQ